MFFRAEWSSDWGAVTPALASPVETTVTLTATDPDGLSASVSGVMLTRWDPLPALGLTLQADDEQASILWPVLDGPTRYELQWRTAGEEFDTTRLRHLGAGDTYWGTRHRVILDDLVNGTNYEVRVIGFDNDGAQVAVESQFVQPVSAVDYIEGKFIDPHVGDHPWLAKAWNGVPDDVSVVVHDFYCCTVYVPPGPDGELAQFRFERPQHQWHAAAYMVLASRYLTSGDMFPEDPERNLSTFSLWLYATHRLGIEGQPKDAHKWALDALAYYTIYGEDVDSLNETEQALAAAASAGRYPRCSTTGSPDGRSTPSATRSCGCFENGELHMNSSLTLWRGPANCSRLLLGCGGASGGRRRRHVQPVGGRRLHQSATAPAVRQRRRGRGAVGVMAGSAVRHNARD